MHIAIVAVSNRLPNWVLDVSQDYINRLPKHIQLERVLVKPSKPRQEAQKLLQATPKKGQKSIRIALCTDGNQQTTEEFSEALLNYQNQARDLVFYIGGADGLDQQLQQHCDYYWSLSQLTFAHVIAQLVLIEQIYRCFTIIERKPYHLGHL